MVANEYLGDYIHDTIKKATRDDALDCPWNAWPFDPHMCDGCAMCRTMWEPMVRDQKTNLVRLLREQLVEEQYALYGIPR
jgi:hypothetical protein